MNIDDSFKKPGAVPFKWEIRPGVPKVRNQPKQPTPVIKPPPARSYFTLPLEPQRRVPGQPDIVSSGGCFPSPKRVKKRNVLDYYEPKYSSDLGTPSFSSRRSLSSFSSPFGSSVSDSRATSDAEWATFGLF